MRAKATAVTNVHTLPNQLPREKWAKRIAAAWQKQVPSIFEVGALLESAKAELKHGEWIALVKSELPFGRNTAQKLMKIATCDYLRDGEHVHHLPANWGTLYQLTTLTEKQFDLGIKSGAIHPKMQRKDVKAMRGDVAPPKEKKKVERGFIPPLKHCRMTMRRIIFEHADDMPPTEWPELLVALREELDDIDKTMKEELQKNAGHHTAR